MQSEEARQEASAAPGEGEGLADERYGVGGGGGIGEGRTDVFAGGGHISVVSE